MRLGGGARIALNEAIRLEAATEAALSSRPPLMPTSALVPIPPRVAVWLGLSYRFGIPVLAEPPNPPAPPPSAMPDTITLHGLVTTSDASVPPDAHVFVGEDARRHDQFVQSLCKHVGHSIFSG